MTDELDRKESRLIKSVRRLAKRLQNDGSQMTAALKLPIARSPRRPPDQKIRAKMCQVGAGIPGEQKGVKLSLGPLFLQRKLVAGIGFEPMTFRL